MIVYDWLHYLRSCKELLQVLQCLFPGGHLLTEGGVVFVTVSKSAKGETGSVQGLLVSGCCQAAGQYGQSFRHKGELLR